MKKTNLYINADNTKDPYTIVIFAHINEELIEMIKESISEPLHIIYFEDFDWNRDFSPWPYDKFEGHGLDTIKEALDGIVGKVMVVGYSMGGLLALYAASIDSRVVSFASISGSFWYPDLIVHLMNNSINNKTIYLSLGDDEYKTKNYIMHSINERTNQIRDILKDSNKLYFEWNGGNHFRNTEERIIKGMMYLLTYADKN